MLNRYVKKIILKNAYEKPALKLTEFCENVIKIYLQCFSRSYDIILTDVTMRKETKFEKAAHGLFVILFLLNCYFDVVCASLNFLVRLHAQELIYFPFCSKYHRRGLLV